MQEMTNDVERPASGSDAAARNLILVALAFGLGLAGFLGYLAWRGFTVAAPTVLWPESSISRNHKYATGYEPDVPRIDNVAAVHAGLTREARQTVDQGLALYRKSGCALCHGANGTGGVTNPNYEKGTFPSLDTMASKLGLEFPEDVDVVAAMLAAGQSLDDPSKIDVPDGAGVIVGKYTTVRNVILNPIPKVLPKDLNGTEPISMPSYKGKLTDGEINQILASFLILYPIEEEEWEEEETQL